MLLGMGKVYIHMAFSNHMAPSWERKMIGGDSVGKNNPSWTRELKTGASDLWSTATPFVFDTYQELQMREQNGQLALGLNPHSRERERERAGKRPCGNGERWVPRAVVFRAPAGSLPTREPLPRVEKG